MVTTDRQRVAVTGHHPHRQVLTSQCQTGRDGRGTPVNRVHAIGVQVVREPAGAADTADEHDVLALEAKLGQEAADGVEDDVVTAARAPAHLLIGGEVLRLLLLIGGRHQSIGGQAKLQSVQAAGSVRGAGFVQQVGHARSPTATADSRARTAF